MSAIQAPDVAREQLPVVVFAVTSASSSPGSAVRLPVGLCRLVFVLGSCPVHVCPSYRVWFLVRSGSCREWQVFPSFLQPVSHVFALYGKTDPLVDRCLPSTPNSTLTFVSLSVFRKLAPLNVARRMRCKLADLSLTDPAFGYFSELIQV